MGSTVSPIHSKRGDSLGITPLLERMSGMAYVKTSGGKRLKSFQPVLLSRKKKSEIIPARVARMPRGLVINGISNLPFL